MNPQELLDQQQKDKEKLERLRIVSILEVALDFCGLERTERNMSVIIDKLELAIHLLEKPQ